MGFSCFGIQGCGLGAKTAKTILNSLLWGFKAQGNPRPLATRGQSPEAPHFAELEVRIGFQKPSPCGHCASGPKIFGEAEPALQPCSRNSLLGCLNVLQRSVAGHSHQCGKLKRIQEAAAATVAIWSWTIHPFDLNPSNMLGHLRPGLAGCRLALDISDIPF